MRKTGWHGARIHPSELESARGRAIGKVLGDPALRLQLVDHGLKRLEQFSFRRAAEQMLQLYEEVVRPGRRNSA